MNLSEGDTRNGKRNMGGMKLSPISLVVFVVMYVVKSISVGYE
jgi:hypothetical protein|tara:strand:+ start:633 stop:761 length:129 start_codon:yes stop_codon:yes gene_type:complete